MDGTLVDSEKVWTVSLRGHRARGSAASSAPAARERDGRLEHGRARSCCCSTTSASTRTRSGWPQAEQWLTARTGELFAAGLEWRPGALEALRTVRAAGWPTALVTNTGRALTEMALDEHRARALHGHRVRRRGAHAASRTPTRTCGRPSCSGVDRRGLPGGGGLADRAHWRPSGPAPAVLVVPCEVPVPDRAGARPARLAGRAHRRPTVRDGYARAQGERVA